MRVSKCNEKKRKLQEKPVSSESIKMLQHRAALEEKLIKKIVSGFDTSKTDGSKKKLRRTVTGKLETTYDFDDDVVQIDGATPDIGTLSSKLSRIIPAKKKQYKRICNCVHTKPLKLEDGAEVDGSDNVFYSSSKRQRDLKLKMKAEKYSRNPQDVPEADITVDGKRVISAPMEKNRGLTRNRKKQNPRVKQREKLKKAMKRRKGQVPEIRKPTGPYSWEETGINPRVTKSIKLK